MISNTVDLPLATSEVVIVQALNLVAQTPDKDPMEQLPAIGC